MIELVVVGEPGPQGSKKVGRGKTRAGHPILLESSRKVDPWRRAVVAAAHAAGHRPDRPTLTVPVQGAFLFFLPRGRTVRRPVPSVYPDLSKLLRSTEDALTQAGVWADDALLVEIVRLSKRYAGDPGALDHPGAVIRLAPWTPEEPS